MLMKVIKGEAVRQTELCREMIMKQQTDRAVNPPSDRAAVVTAASLPVTHSASQQVLAAS